MTAGIVGEDNLIGRQRHSEAIWEKDEGAWRAVSNNRKCRCPVWLPEEGRRRYEVDEQRTVFHLGMLLRRSLCGLHQNVYNTVITKMRP